ncbi:MAG: PP2C family protein-serine/threonine phosphatase, partial [Thermoflexibacteraceae bacterium]
KLVKTMKENENFILSQNTFLENTVTLRTAQLSEANEELKQIVEELHSTVELVNKQKEELDIKNQNITASIRYALTLQTSILPTEHLLKVALNEYFIFYKPKDIVSGDFYFCYYQEASKTTFLSVIDCTGHGVPGAFMSMLVHNLLLETIEIREIHRPAEIFNYVSQSLVKFLRKNNPNNTDGFDAILCKLQEHNNFLDLVFVTTKLPLYVYHHTSQRIFTYYGDVAYVGAEDKDEPQSFNEQNLKLYKGDQFFLASDGITDQPNEERKRWGTKRFIQLLEQVATENCTAQLYHIEQALAVFAQKAPQRDDITVMGVKIS